MFEQRQPAPEILYHYTNVDAFRNILESRSIWATRYDQMNDESELRIGAQRLLEAVESYPTAEGCREYRDFLISAIGEFREGGLNVFVMSLSEEPDSLYQWRAYAPRGGVAIGFDAQMLQKGLMSDITPKVGGGEVQNALTPDPSNRLIRCTYTDRQGQVDLREVVAEQFFKDGSFPTIFLHRQKPLGDTVLYSTLAVAIYRTISSIKHGAYSQEREWRCVNFNPKPRKYPVRLGERCRSYIEMRFEPAADIREVWISPHGDKESCESAVRYFMQKYQWRPIIQKSTIPFRG